MTCIKKSYRIRTRWIYLNFTEKKKENVLQEKDSTKVLKSLSKNVPSLMLKYEHKKDTIKIRCLRQSVNKILYFLYCIILEYNLYDLKVTVKHKYI